MDRLWRLTALFLLGLTVFAFGMGQARAQYEYTGKVNGPTTPKVPQVETAVAKFCTPYSTNPATGFFATGTAACAAQLTGTCELGFTQCTGGTFNGAPASCKCSYKTVCPGGSFIGSSAGYTQCWQFQSSPAFGGFVTNTTAPTRTVQVCPEGSVEDGGVCYTRVCPTATPPWEPDPGNSSQCRRVADCPYPQKFVVASGTCECDSGTLWAVPEGGGLANPVHGMASVPWTSADLSAKPTTGCMSETGAAGEGGCTFNVSAWGWNGTRLQLDGDNFAGTKCTVPANNQHPTTQCPIGQVVGTINGSSVCVEAGSTETKKAPTTTTETKTNADGTTTTTATTTEEVTKCEGGICTTTVTKSVTITHKDANGAVTGTESGTSTTTKPGSGSGTGEGEGGSESSFGGSCPTFNCEGDAVQCAMALEQHKRNCEVLTDVGSLTRAAAAQGLEDVLTFDKSTLTTTGSLESIGSSTFLGGGCLADLTVSVQGYSLVIPFSALCVYLQAAGLAFMAVCGLISFGVVSRGVTA